MAESDTDDDNDGEFFYNEAQQADSSDDDSDSDDVTPTKPSKRNSAQASKPTSNRSSTSQPYLPATTSSSHPPTAVVPTMPAIPVQRPTCCICTSVELIDPWLSACSHLCCGECWVAWLMEQSESGDMTGGACPECSKAIDLEGLKRVVLCDRCARLCVSGAGQHYTAASTCRHTCCLQCWKGQLVNSQTVSCHHGEAMVAGSAGYVADVLNVRCVCCLCAVLCLCSVSRMRRCCGCGAVSCRAVTFVVCSHPSALHVLLSTEWSWRAVLSAQIGPRAPTAAGPPGNLGGNHGYTKQAECRSAQTYHCKTLDGLLSPSNSLTFGLGISALVMFTQHICCTLREL